MEIDLVLEEAAVNYAEQFMKEADNVEIEQAKWRNRHPEESVVHGGIKACFLFQRDAFKAGAQWQMSQMIKDATEVTVHIEAGNYPYIPQLELYDYDKDVPLAKEGDKYTVVLIK